MADYDNLVQGQLVETTAHINGWQKVRRLTIGGALLHALSDGAEISFVTGTYTGDGAATKAITGVGFQPRMVVAYAHQTAVMCFKTNQDALYTHLSASYHELDHIISLDSNGFTVGDGTGSATGGNVLNINAAIYTYIAFR